MKVSIADQIAEIERYRNGLQGFVDNGVEPKEGPPAAVRLDRAEAALLTLNAWAAYAADIEQSNTTKGA
ncbi:hypothetical protein [Devosia alba]|uniref:hypothetical protein n=1 Tax=Devosia alba TaxID=3152360 RepID=UPI003264051F